MEKHREALDVVAGNPPRQCGECRVTFDELTRRSGGQEFWMALHMKDGMYQLLCQSCDVKYVIQRRDLYGGTPFGQERKL
jgi:hypothetical protein